MLQLQSSGFAQPHILLNKFQLFFDMLERRRQHILPAQHATKHGRKSKHFSVIHNAAPIEHTHRSSQIHDYSGYVTRTWPELGLDIVK